MTAHLGSRSVLLLLLMLLAVRAAGGKGQEPVFPGKGGEDLLAVESEAVQAAAAARAADVRAEEARQAVAEVKSLEEQAASKAAAQWQAEEQARLAQSAAEEQLKHMKGEVAVQQAETSRLVKALQEQAAKARGEAQRAAQAATAAGTDAGVVQPAEAAHAAPDAAHSPGNVASAPRSPHHAAGGEDAKAVHTEERKRLWQRAHGWDTEGRRKKLDEALKTKVQDNRCLPPKGFPNMPEGFVCTNDTALIYCSTGKRLTVEDKCLWEGQCEPGLIGTGGCKYPLCAGRNARGTYCRKDGIYSCLSIWNHSREEVASIQGRSCPAGTKCHVWDDGPPPSRRRRTRTCETDEHGWTTCTSDPAGPSFATCVQEHCNYRHSECMV